MIIMVGHDGMQADMAPGKELRLLHLARQAAGRESHAGPSLNLKAYLQRHTSSQVLQQGHTSDNATPCDSMGVISFKPRQVVLKTSHTKSF